MGDRIAVVSAAMSRAVSGDGRRVVTLNCREPGDGDLAVGRFRRFEATAALGGQWLVMSEGPVMSED